MCSLLCSSERLGSQVAELDGELLQTEPNTFLDRAQWPIEQLGELAVRVAAEVDEHERSPLQRRQRAQGVQHACALDAGYSLVPDVRRALHEVLYLVGELARSQRARVICALAGEVQDAVAGDRGQPGSKGPALLVELMGLFP